MGVARGSATPNPPEIFFIKNDVVYSTVCSVLYAVRCLYTSELESSRTWPYPRGSSRPVDHVLGLGFKSLQWFWPWTVSPWLLPWVPSPQLAFALEDVLDIVLEHSNFLATNPAPASILTSVKKYLDFIPGQSCSACCVDLWKAVQQEADFQVLLSPAGKHLLQHSHLGTDRNGCSATVDCSTFKTLIVFAVFRTLCVLFGGCG